MGGLNWFGILLIVLWGLDVFFGIILVDRPRGPVSAGDLVAKVVINALMLWALLTVGTHHPA